jgi:hypothetical protein
MGAAARSAGSSHTGGPTKGAHAVRSTNDRCVQCFWSARGSGSCSSCVPSNTVIYIYILPVCIAHVAGLASSQRTLCVSPTAHQVCSSPSAGIGVDVHSLMPAACTLR